MTTVKQITNSIHVNPDWSVNYKIQVLGFEMKFVWFTLRFTGYMLLWGRAWNNFEGRMFWFELNFGAYILDVALTYAICYSCTMIGRLFWRCAPS